MPKFEHICDSTTEYPFQVGEILKSRSEEGWELVTVVKFIYDGMSERELYFKRPVQKTKSK